MDIGEGAVPLLLGGRLCSGVQFSTPAAAAGANGGVAGKWLRCCWCCLSWQVLVASERTLATAQAKGHHVRSTLIVQKDPKLL